MPPNPPFAAITTGSLTAVCASPGHTVTRPAAVNPLGVSASIASTHQCLLFGVEQLTYRRQPPSGRATSAGRSNDAVSERFLRERHERRERETVVGAGDDDRIAATGVDRAAQTVSKVNTVVGRDRARSAGPEPRSGARRRDDGRAVASRYRDEGRVPARHAGILAC